MEKRELTQQEKEEEEKQQQANNVDMDGYEEKRDKADQEAQANEPPAPEVNKIFFLFSAATSSSIFLNRFINFGLQGLASHLIGRHINPHCTSDPMMNSTRNVVQGCACLHCLRFYV